MKMEESNMAKKTVNFNKSGVAKLPKNKPVIYKIKTESGKTNYVGIAKRGRAQERIQEHLDASIIPGAKVQVEQVKSIADAQKKEKNIISRTKPKYNKKGK
jgi:excinuclease UvrABC nuclease subunit